MPYQFATERPDYSDLSSGRFFYSAAGHPAFPVRLASEILQRCLALRRQAGLPLPGTLYDPCCGTGYLLAVLAYLHGEQLARVIASDADTHAIDLARRNLDLLTPAGLERRAGELEALLSQYGKPAHQEALESARRMQARVAGLGLPAAQTFRANALAAGELASHLPGRTVDLIITDVPYGQHSNWMDLPAGADPLAALLAALAPILAPGGIVAIASDKGQKVPRDGWRRLEHFQVGKRRIEILDQNNG